MLHGLWLPEITIRQGQAAKKIKLPLRRNGTKAATGGASFGSAMLRASAFRKRTLSSPWQSVTFLASQF
jgi:hypothetical protein